MRSGPMRYEIGLSIGRVLHISAEIDEERLANPNGYPGRLTLSIE
jgi:hypothetical protein